VRTYGSGPRFTRRASTVGTLVSTQVLQPPPRPAPLRGRGSRAFVEALGWGPPVSMAPTLAAVNGLCTCDRQDPEPSRLEQPPRRGGGLGPGSGPTACADM